MTQAQAKQAFNDFIKTKAPRQPLRLNIQFFAEGKNGDGGDDHKNDPSAQITKLLGEVKEASKGFAAELQKQDEEIKKHGQVTDKTKNRVDEMEKKYTALQDDMKKLLRPGQGGTAQQKSAGQMFIESDQYKNMLDSRDLKSAPLQVKSFFSTKDLTTGGGSGGELIVRDRQDGIITTPDREFWLRDLLDVRRTNSNSIEYVRETGFTNNAAPTAEGALKPQSDLTYTTETAGVKVIAHWIPATRQVLSDAPQLRGIIDGRLRYGLKLEEERQILYGDGTGENLSGLLTDPDIQDVGGVGALRAGDNMLDHLRRAMTRVLLAGYPATGLTMHPVNFEDIELMKADNGQYLWLNVGDQLNPRLFRLPIVQTPSIVVNEFLMGAFGLGAQLWDRWDAEVRVGEPGDYFLRNMVAVLAEERLGLTKYRPEAFVTGTLTAAPAGV